MMQVALLKFVRDAAAEEPFAVLGEAEMDLIDIGDDGHVVAECDQSALATASFEDFPASLTVQGSTTLSTDAPLEQFVVLKRHV
jgi:hypothetical protein